MTRTWPIRAANVWFEGMNHEIRSETYLLSQASTGLTHFMVRSEQPEKWYEIRARHGIPFFCAGQFLHLDFQLQCEIRPSTDSLVE